MTSENNQSINKEIMVKELGDMLENILRGTDSEYSEIYLNYLERIYKITKLFMKNITNELHDKKEKEDNSDNEELIKRYTNDTGDIDSVSEYEESDNDSDIDFNELEVNNKIQIKEALNKFDTEIKQIYENLKKEDIITFNKS